MYQIATLNKISKVGLDQFTDQYQIVEGSESPKEVTGILVRSQNMLDMQFDDYLLAIARAGAGVNNIPVDRCADEGIVVFNTPGANANSVKELVLAAMIMSSRNMAESVAWVNSLGDDDSIQDYSKAVEKGKSQFAGHEIQGKTLGVIGLGAIGALVANASIGLGMNVIGYDPYLTDAARERLLFDVKIVDTPQEAVSDADFVTLHVPSMDSTNGMIDKELLSAFKDGSILLNFSRDKLVVEEDILDALDNGKLYKYATDFATNKIMGNPKITIMPHLGASTEEAEDNCAIMASQELMAFIEKGEIKNSVNFPAVSLEEDAEFKIAITTKGEPDPVKLISAMFANKTIKAVVGGIKGEYGYAILATDDEITQVPDVDEVTRVRVIAKDL